MPKEAISFETFVEAAGPQHKEFIDKTHKLLLKNDCAVDIKEAKSGLVVSYVYKPEKKTLLNYVFRKKGSVMRIYADHVPAYMELLGQWPDSMKKVILKAGPCKRMLNPSACNPRCTMGFDFIMDGERQQKCRYNCFLFFLEDETKPRLEEMIKQELQSRTT